MTDKGYDITGLPVLLLVRVIPVPLHYHNILPLKTRVSVAILAFKHNRHNRLKITTTGAVVGDALVMLLTKVNMLYVWVNLLFYCKSIVHVCSVT